MRVARKITLLFELAILLLITAFGYFVISRESQTVRKDLISDLESNARLGSTLLSKLDRTVAGDPLGRLGSPNDYEARWIDLRATPGSPDGPAVVGADVERMPLNSERVIENAGRLYVYRAFEDAHGRQTAIEVSHATADLERAVDSSVIATIVVCALILVLGSIYALTIGSTMLSRPIRRVMEQFRRVGDGDLTPIGGAHRKDEFGALSAELDVMITRLAQARTRSDEDHAARLAAVEQVRHSDRLTTVGTLAAGMAHELGTPLNVISGYAKLIATGQETGEGAIDSARIIGEQTQRVTDLVRHLLDFSRRGALKRGVADIRPTIARALEVVSIAAHKAHVRLRYTQPEAPVLADIDEAKIQQVVVNLAINAIHASSTGADVELAVTRALVAPPGGGTVCSHVRLDIVDRGKGIPAEHLERVFEPFFTTKAVGEGTGLGLAVSRGIVEEHRGWVEVSSELGAGSTFSVFLPEAKAPAT